MDNPTYLIYNKIETLRRLTRNEIKLVVTSLVDTNELQERIKGLGISEFVFKTYHLETYSGYLKTAIDKVRHYSPR